MHPDAIYVSTHLGYRFYPQAPSIADVAIEDIAHGLAFQCRFNGQTQHFYSVAQHSLMVAALVPRLAEDALTLPDESPCHVDFDFGGVCRRPALRSGKPASARGGTALSE